MDGKKINPNRRFFLAAASFGSAIAVAALASRKTEVAQEAPPSAPTNPETGVGYHETEHIRKYYATAAYF